jgi:hypothetical protein
MIVVEARTTALTARCPDWRQTSDRVHSRYFGHPKDLPWTGIQMQWHMRVRRFRSLNSDCHRKLFAERLPGPLHPSARRTNRFTSALSRLALALGGQAGARLGSHLGLCPVPAHFCSPSDARSHPQLPTHGEWAQVSHRYATQAAEDGHSGLARVRGT